MSIHDTFNLLLSLALHRRCYCIVKSYFISNVPLSVTLRCTYLGRLAAFRNGLQVLALYTVRTLLGLLIKLFQENAKYFQHHIESFKFVASLMLLNDFIVPPKPCFSKYFSVHIIE